MRVAVALLGFAIMLFVGVVSLALHRRRALTRDLEEIARMDQLIAARMGEIIQTVAAVESRATMIEERQKRLP